MYMYATGLDKSAVNMVFNFTREQQEELDVDLTRSTPFDDADPSTPVDGVPKLLYSLAFIGPAYKTGKFPADAERLVEYETNVKFLANDPVKINELKKIVSYPDDGSVSSVYEFCTKMVKTTKTQFKRLLM